MGKRHIAAAGISSSRAINRLSAFLMADDEQMVKMLILRQRLAKCRDPPGKKL